MRPRLRGPRRTRETSAAAWKPDKQPCVLLCLDSRSQDRGSATASPYLAEDQFDLENCSLASVFPHAVLGSIRPASWDFDDVGWVPSLPRAAKLPPPLRFPTSWTQVDVAQFAVTKAPSAHDAFTRPRAIYQTGARRSFSDFQSPTLPLLETRPLEPYMTRVASCPRAGSNASLFRTLEFKRRRHFVALPADTQRRENVCETLKKLIRSHSRADWYLVTRPRCHSHAILMPFTCPVT
ncbi:hypothetical protein B0J14DRAFT_216510 [Halenospora varia]|nr:hypothetical protein B0J14DRAFT_216510 [Halenospora varia]